jgi:hypothetical protein
MALFEKEEFTATGPPQTGSGFPRAAFSVREPPGATGDFVHGVNVVGVKCGVLGLTSLPSDALREARVEGTGVEGRGAVYGVVGRLYDHNPNPEHKGRAGVLGFHNNASLNASDHATGVIGAVMKGGVGVVGICVESFDRLGIDDIPDPAAGEGTGVLGTTGTGTGVRGSAKAGTGVEGTGSDAGVRGNGTSAGTGVHGVAGEGIGIVGESTGRGRGGRFISNAAAQIQLIPWRDPLRTLEEVQLPSVHGYSQEELKILALHLPAKAQGGDLACTRMVRRPPIGPVVEICQLWFCEQSPQAGASAVWRQVLLGDRIFGGRS